MFWRENMSDSGQAGRAGWHSPARRGERPSERGIALVITLLLLLLLSVIGLAAVLSASSDLLINGYYSNYRGSFYAADSGINIARQDMYNQLNHAFTTTYTTFVYPPPAGVAALGGTVQNVIKTEYAGAGGPCPINPTSPPAIANSKTCYLSIGTPGGDSTTWQQNSWQESFQLDPNNVSLNMVSATPGYVGSTNPAEPTSVTYVYSYTLKSIGSATGSEQSTIIENGSFNVYTAGIPASYNASFAIYGAFVTNWDPCTLGWLVPGTMTGTMFTDGSWGFGSGTYIFTDPVGQADANASWWVDGCWQAPTSSYTAPDGEIVAPQFQGGFSVGQPRIPQPQNSYSQEWAAIDGMGINEVPSQPGATQLNEYMKTVTGTPYPTGGASSGVYLNYSTNPTTGQLTINGGGLYVEGNANIGLSTSGASAQVFTITQGSPVTTTTMVVDPVANTTVVSSQTGTGPVTTLSLSGVPTNLSLNPPQSGTMIYVDGTITSMSGPGEGVGAIQDGSAVTITALGDINITGDVIYKTEPVTMTQNQIPGTPVATLIPGNDHNQDLGIFTANGSIILSSPYPDDNLQVDGSQAVIGNSCASWSCGFYVNGCINTFNNVGGQIQTNIFGACLNTENTYYDRRYTSRVNFAPPWFPSTTITNTAATTTVAPTITPQRLGWVATTGQ
jgi:Tfp pilus assembly protein PilX